MGFMRFSDSLIKLGIPNFQNNWLAGYLAYYRNWNG